MWIVGASKFYTQAQSAHSFFSKTWASSSTPRHSSPSASLVIPLSLSDLWLGPGFGSRISPLPNLDWLFAMEKLKTCSLHCSRWSILPHIFVVVTFFGFLRATVNSCEIDLRDCIKKTFSYRSRKLLNFCPYIMARRLVS